MEWSRFLIDASGFYAFLPTRPASIGVPDHWFGYLEPQVVINPWVGLGLSGEVHQYLDSRPKLFRSLLIGHVNPHEKVKLMLFGGPSLQGQLKSWQIGGEFIAEF